MIQLGVVPRTAPRRFASIFRATLTAILLLEAVSIRERTVHFQGTLDGGFHYPWTGPVDGSGNFSVTDLGSERELEIVRAILR